MQKTDRWGLAVVLSLFASSFLAVLAQEPLVKNPENLKKRVSTYYDVAPDAKETEKFSVTEEFDEKGKIAKRVTKFPGDKEGRQTRRVDYARVYDGEGRLVESTQTDSSGIVLEKLVNKYGGDGSWTTVRELPEGVVTSRFNEEKKLVSEDYKGKDGTRSNRIYRYTENNHLREIDAISDGVSSRRIYKNDEKGRVLEVSYLVEGKSGGGQKFQYNSYGEVSRITEYDSGGKVVQIQTFVYKHDANGRTAEISVSISSDLDPGLVFRMIIRFDYEFYPR